MFYLRNLSLNRHMLFFSKNILICMATILLIFLCVNKVKAINTVTVNFDTPTPPGSPDSTFMGTFQGIVFTANEWYWTGPYASDPTNAVYFSANVASRTFSFANGARVLKSMRVYTTNNGTLTLTDNTGQSKVQAITTGSMQLVTTNWTIPSTTITVNFTAGWSLGVDDIVYEPCDINPVFFNSQ